MKKNHLNISLNISNKRFRRRLKSNLKKKIRNQLKSSLSVQIKQKKSTPIKYSYRKLTNELIENTIISYSDVYRDLNVDLEETFQFYQEVLVQNKYFGISPSYILFDTDTSFNAKAGKSNGHYIIRIHIGAANAINNMFKNDIELISHAELSQYRELENKLDVSLNILLYQNVYHYLFYH